jgi:UDPglucose 6-dehydrogenase
MNNNKIGIIGYGMVGKAVAYGFSKADIIISDPQYNSVTIRDICNQNPVAIFICVPTPTDDTDYAVLKNVLREIVHSGYIGLTVVKSTILPHHLDEFNILYNPEFLSRATSLNDFVNPPMIIIGGDRGDELLEIYKKYSTVNVSKVFLTDIKTASLSKYSMNSFYALKVTYMNSIYDAAQELGADYSKIVEILSQHPWMGTHHFQVPGPDGQRGFGGPCLPKDTEALTNRFDIKLLDTVLLLNKEYRNKGEI